MGVLEDGAGGGQRGRRGCDRRNRLSEEQLTEWCTGRMAGGPWPNSHEQCCNSPSAQLAALDAALPTTKLCRPSGSRLAWNVSSTTDASPVWVCEIWHGSAALPPAAETTDSPATAAAAGTSSSTCWLGRAVI